MQTNVKRSIVQTFAGALALAFIAGPLLASAAEAGGTRRKGNAQMMRLGGPAETATRRKSNGMMRLGGPASAGNGRGIGGFTVEANTGLERRGTCQFCTSAQSRDFFLAVDRTGRN